MVEYSTIEPWQAVDENGVVYDLDSLMAYFQELMDPRKARGKRYQLVTLLVLVFLAKLSGVDGPSAIADWCQAHRAELVKLLHLQYEKLPKHNTIRRLFETVLEEEAFEQKMREYGERQRAGKEPGKLLALDGKKQRGTNPPGENQGEATLAVYAPESQEVIAQVAIDPSEGEIPTAQRILQQVNIVGKVIVADAMHTQRKLCQQIVDAQADYLLSVKDNQPSLLATLETLFLTHPQIQERPDFQTAHQFRKRHGRLEERTLTTTARLQNLLDWPQAAQAFRLERKFSFLRKGQIVRVEQHVQYGLTSCPRKTTSADQLLTMKRQYWQIENGLHYRRDVTFHEDATRMSHPHASRNLTTVHNTILSLFARLGCRNAAATRRRLDGDLRLAFSLLISAHPRL
jgi:predicted transposase YbfD/YdcC